jgi:SAM-dependent methyltransferase
MNEPKALAHLLPVTKIAEHDQMFQGNYGHYFGVGLSAAWTIESILRARSSFLATPSSIRDILDVGCGCGRVARFLRVQHPDALLHVTDIRKADVDWCCTNLGCVPAPDVLPPKSYDLIWLGSVFTHLNAEAAEKLLAQLLACLRPSGVLAFSTTGRLSYSALKALNWDDVNRPARLSYNLPKEYVAQLLSGWESSGYGYVNYPEQRNYGVAIVKPHWYSDIVFRLADVTQIYLQERAWDEHHDVIAFMSRELMARRSPTFESLGQQFKPG